LAKWHGGFIVPGASANPPRSYPNVLKAVFDTPWAITPEMLGLIAEVARFRAEGGTFSEDEIQQRIDAQSNGPRRGGRQASGVAVIPIYGVLSQRMNLMSAMSGGTSIEGLTSQFRDALADPDVGAIVFDIDSPGGSVEGIEELATEIRAARGQKRMVAVADSMAASAAYWLAAQADEVVVTPSGSVGSIGILAIHEDFSQAKENLGIKTTFITAGKYKAEGHEDLPLTDEAIAYVQAQADEFYSMFLTAVAKGRDVTAARAGSADFGEGRVLLAKAAKAAGMVDRIDTLDATVARMGRLTARRTGANLAAAWVAGFEAAAIGRHKTATSEDEWDGPANEKRLPNERGPLRSSHAWVDDDGDPDAKASYKFIHHEVSADGDVGAANLTACSTGIGVLNGGRRGTTIPASDRAGVHAHLAGHLTDADREAPPLQGSAERLPFNERLVLATDEAAELVAHARERARLRAKEGRPGVSEPLREQLSALSDSFGSIRDEIGQLLDTDEPEEAAATTPSARRHLEIFEAAARYGIASNEVPPS
jgi:signal peptide peptidase SppA